MLACTIFTGASRGKITLQTEEVADSKFNIAMRLSATKLDKKDFFGKVSVKLYDIAHFLFYIMYMYTHTAREVMRLSLVMSSPKWKFKKR